MSKRSEVWKFFTIKKDNSSEATCAQCGKTIGCKGSTTTALINHLKVHGISVKRIKDFSDVEIDSKLPKISNICSTTLYFTKEESLGEILSRVAVVDCMPITAIPESKAVKHYAESKGFDLPKNTKTVISEIMRYYQEKHVELRDRFDYLKARNQRFSITVDEWTDCVRNYVNVTAHVFDREKNSTEAFVLGLSEIKKEITAHNIKMAITEKLTEFDLDLEKDVISCTHNGTSVMVKYGTSTNAISQTCHNTAIHSVVMDCLYEKNDELEIDEADDSDNEETIDTDDENVQTEDEDTFMYAYNIDIVSNEQHSIQDNLKIIHKLRSIVKMFKKSAAKSFLLKKNVMKFYGTDIKLMLDNETRWNSINSMITSFLKISGAVNETLQDLKLEIVSCAEINELKDVWIVLLLLETAVNNSSSNDTTLMTVEEVYAYLYEKCEQNHTDLGRNILSTLKRRMDERRLKLVTTLILYLKTGTFPASSKYLKYESKNEVIMFATKIIMRLYSELVINNSVENPNEASPNNLTEDLENKISSIMNVSASEVDDAFKLIKMRFNHFDIVRKRCNILDALYYSLLTIKPTSVSNERVFSTQGIIKTKFRPGLDIRTFNALLFLKCVFSKLE